MKIDADRFRVRPGERVRLKKWPTRVKPFYASKAESEAQLARHVEQLSELQNLLYADDRYALLLIFQAMDAAGKDSCIKHVMSGVNPQGCQVYSFKHPSAEELDHDFLWRTHARAARARAHRHLQPLLLRGGADRARAPGDPARAEGAARAPGGTRTIWEERYRSITDMEAHLDRNGTRVVKFFLHVSKDEQRERFLARIDEPEKNWKFSRAGRRGAQVLEGLHARLRRLPRAPPAPSARPGTWCPPTTSRTRASSSRASSSTR